MGWNTRELSLDIAPAEVNGGNNQSLGVSKMKIELNTNLVRIFTGTYNTIWEIVESADNGDELAIEYDFNEFMGSIVQTYQEERKNIVGALNIPFLTGIEFSGSHSPREYNFRTDELDFTATINKKGLIKTIKSLKGDQVFEQYLKDNFTSRDGFMSFTPNTYSELLEQIVTQGDEFEQALGALITFLTGRELLQEVELDIYETWAGNGYAGLDYQIRCDSCDREVSYAHAC